MQLSDLGRLPVVGALLERARNVLVGSPPRAAVPAQVPPALGREAKVLFALDRRGRGLEIGPSFNPIAPKSAGFNVEIIDHATAPELREKYRVHPNVDISRIEEVDQVWRGESLDELLGVARYDWIIASHVIEHLPDLVSFLRQCTRLLSPGGVLSLVIPDKRYCFDYFRWPSTTGDLLQAFTEARRRHPAGVVFDHVAQIVRRGGGSRGTRRRGGDFSFIHEFDEAKSAFDAPARARPMSTSTAGASHPRAFT